MLPAVKRSYAVTWQEPEAPAHAGKLELGAQGIALEGLANSGRPAALLIPYEELSDLRLAASGERVGGRPTLLIDRGDRGCLRVTGVGGPGVVSELVDALTRLMR